MLNAHHGVAQRALGAVVGPCLGAVVVGEVPQGRPDVQDLCAEPGEVGGVAALAGLDGVHHAVVDVVQRAFVPGQCVAVAARLGVGANRLVDQRLDRLAVSARGAVALGEGLNVSGQVRQADLTALGVDEVIDAVAVADQQPVEVAEQLTRRRSGASAVDPVAGRRG
jgi:hypothetical protein